MEKKLRKKIFPLMAIIGITVALSSCKNTFDIQPEVSVDAKNAYQTLSDADASVMGVYSGVLDVGAQYVVLNELRGDLLDVTPNADDALQAINSHVYDVPSQDNVTNTVSGYADPSSIYKVILNCNDVLKNFSLMRNKFLLTSDQYNQRYSDVLAVRCWLYLQLAIHYGEVPYVTEPFEKIADLNNAANYPRVPLPAMIDSLIKTMISLPYFGNYPSTSTLMNISSGTFTSTPFFINKVMLLGDLYLWKNDYYDAALCYKVILDSPASNDFQMYRMAYADVTNHNDLAVAYKERYQYADINGLIDSDTEGWRSIFCRTQDKTYYWEWIWQLFYDNKNKSSSPFVSLFANYGEGKYLLKPSQQVIDLWNSQIQNNGFPYDARKILSMSVINGQPVVRKYLYKYDELKPFEKPGRLFLYRVTGLHLRYIEAANRDNKCKIALALLNRGIHTEFSPYRDFSQGQDTVADITDIQRTDGAKYQNTFPYNFDARSDNGTFNFSSKRKSAKTGNDTTVTIQVTQFPVSIRGTWYQNAGVRSHAYVQPVLTDRYDTHSVTLSNSDGLKDSIERAVIDEDALELAFEGERWSDLLRVAMRRNDPSFLADKVYSKLLKAGNPNAEAARINLMNRKWFLPFKLK